MRSNHFDDEGKAVIVDVSNKEITRRVAIATGSIRMNIRAFGAVASGSVAKGDVLGIARVAGIMAAKRTADLIPLCHPLMTEKVGIDFRLNDGPCTVTAICTAQATGKTGVEMEALCGVNIALLTIYDMCKALDKSMVIHDVHLLEKQGGKSGHYRYGAEQ